MSRLVGKELQFRVQGLFLAIFACASGRATAQQAATPSQIPAPTTSSPPDSAQPKNDRIFGVVPNYRTVENPQAKIEPITVKQKFRLAADDSFDPCAYVIAGVFVGIAQTQNDPPSWGEESWGPFSRRYAASFADQTIENFMAEAVVPSLLKQDPRYFRLGTSTFFKRSRYAVSRIWVTRTDAGGSAFKFSEIGGKGISSLVSNAYYPPRTGRSQES